jgi:hypothetical protein
LVRKEPINSSGSRGDRFVENLTSPSKKTKKRFHSPFWTFSQVSTGALKTAKMSTERFSTCGENLRKLCEMRWQKEKSRTHKKYTERIICYAELTSLLPECPPAKNSGREMKNSVPLCREMRVHGAPVHRAADDAEG